MNHSIEAERTSITRDGICHSDPGLVACGRRNQGDKGMRALFIAASLATVTVALPAQAQPAPEAMAGQADENAEARLSVAREIVATMGAEQQMDMMVQTLRPTLASSVVGNLSTLNPSRDLLAEVEENYPGGASAFGEAFADRYAVNFRTRYPEIVEEIAHYYASNMSLEQLTATLAFFRSDNGSAWVELMPAAQQHMTQVGAQYGLQANIQTAAEMLSDLTHREQGGALDSNLDAMRDGDAETEETEE
ncbi:DUF2059 domain-containing protein [Parasphingopyxis marina]|uniref:DUF2059 domain-containing protein n=1 Tax=Parasphingopyxis marina TaxID=2761622 RepID=A0A842I2W9_9SPHN|nr:DUF2059 domain-containing protein [Parasphingopyxis marina]MBC2778650.1 DUF2059 domain-containing protein [Parasphingopyxis marina]